MRHPQDSDSVLGAAAGLDAELLDSEPAVSGALVSGRDVEPSDPAAEIVDRAVRVEAAHDRPDEVVVVVDQSGPCGGGMGVGLGEGHRDGRDELPLLPWLYLQRASVQDVMGVSRFPVGET